MSIAELSRDRAAGAAGSGEEASASRSPTSRIGAGMLKQSEEYVPAPLTKERLSAFREPDRNLAKFVSKYGYSTICGHPNVVKEHLKTTHTIEHGSPTDQKMSGRCWIYGSLNMLRINVLKEYGKEFQYSQNYIAFWDKLERANYYLEKMIEMADLDPMDQRILNMLDNLYGDGGEWELFQNIVEKYGLVPNYAMPETEFSGKSAGYMSLLRGRLNEVGGILHQKAKEGCSHNVLQAIKNRTLQEVYTLLIHYLGFPPKDFIWKTEEKVEKITPVEFYRRNGVDLNEMVHLTHLPYRKEGTFLEVQDVGNLVEGIPLRGLNISIQELKEAAYRSIKEGFAVPVAAETMGMDRKSGLCSLQSDRDQELFGFDPTRKLDKAKRLTYRRTSVAHLMNLVGCDGPEDKVREEGFSAEYGRLWKLENSWKDLEEISMTDEWFDEYVYGVVVQKRFLSKKLQKLWDNREEHTEKVPAWDPFGRI